MEGLKSYFAIIDPRLLHHVKGKPGEFIRIFQEQEYLSEEAFIQRICNEKFNRVSYQELKSRTLKILQAFAIVSTSKGNSLVKKKYDFCQKNFTIGQKFLNNGQRAEGLRLVKLAYRVATAFDFVHLACELSSILYHDHIYYHPNQRQANFYAKQADDYLQDYIAEKKAEHLFYQVMGNLHDSPNSAVFKKALSKINQWKGRSLKYRVYQSMLQVLYGLNIADYELVINSCSETLQFFKNKKGVYTSHHQFFLSKLGAVQVATARYREAENSFVEAGKITLPKSINDYLLRLYRTINALHSGNYQQAYELYRQNRKCRFEKVRQQFAIIEAYLCFLSHLGYLQLDRPFRLGKYLNDTFKAQADKQGDNISILIAELLVYLTRNKGKFIDRVQAISNYSYRHLKGKETQRAKHFIKILYTLPKANFNPIALERKAQKHIQYIREHPICMGDNVGIEIIPFDRLLDMLFTQLQQKVA